ncbi:hypothetical protein QKD28_gp2 [Wenling hoplichthys paramyxovirus]|uniref:Uncharacterized protein n=1 Tax=Wenling hoplichthys paramyxovirus TaxID=2116453 RepID=A0A2P1GN16_9MONO|nr:hypothetical protein QKD28_gp2 [Wenling hoplichthys paramyxovirus]AVM87393.1 hypothetical protein [Wenling hoplichthys paramyxovirus]
MDAIANDLQGIPLTPDKSLRASLGPLQGLSARLVKTNKELVESEIVNASEASEPDLTVKQKHTSPSSKTRSDEKSERSKKTLGSNERTMREIIQEEVEKALSKVSNKTDIQIREVNKSLGEIGEMTIKLVKRESEMMDKIDRLTDSIRKSDVKYEEMKAVSQQIPSSVKSLTALGEEVRCALRELKLGVTKLDKFQEISFEIQTEEAMKNRKDLEAKSAAKKRETSAPMKPSSFEFSNQADNIKKAYESGGIRAMGSDSEEEEEDDTNPAPLKHILNRSGSLTSHLCTYEEIESLIFSRYTGKEQEEELNKMDQAMARGTSAETYKSMRYGQ